MRFEKPTARRSEATMAIVAAAARKMRMHLNMRRYAEVQGRT